MRRKYGYKPELTDHRDKLYRLIAPSVSLPVAVDLRPSCPPIFDQEDLGACTASGLSTAVEFMDSKEGLPHTALSRLFIYFNERAMHGNIDRDSGSTLRDGVKSLTKYGVCPESVWPYQISQFDDVPTPEAYAEAESRKLVSYHRILNVQEMLRCLAEGFPFVFGLSVYESFESEDTKNTGVVVPPRPHERMIGGHCMCAVGYSMDDNFFIVANCWGSDWGQDGFCFIPFHYMETADDIWTLRR